MIRGRDTAQLARDAAKMRAGWNAPPAGAGPEGREKCFDPRCCPAARIGGLRDARRALRHAPVTRYAAPGIKTLFCARGAGPCPAGGALLPAVRVGSMRLRQKSGSPTTVGGSVLRIRPQWWANPLFCRSLMEPTLTAAYCSSRLRTAVYCS